MTELLQDDNEHPIPLELRPTFQRIAKAFADGDFSLASHKIESVDPVTGNVAQHISDCIGAYGDRLVGLNPATWERSCYRHDGDHWIGLIDLTTAREAVSDLTLHVRINLDPDLRIQIESVHVA